MRKILSVHNNCLAQYKPYFKAPFCPKIGTELVEILQSDMTISIDMLTQIANYAVRANRQANQTIRTALLNEVVSRCLNRIQKEGDETDLIILAKLCTNRNLDPSTTQQLAQKILDRVIGDLSRPKKVIYSPSGLSVLARFTRLPGLNNHGHSNQIDTISDQLESQLYYHLLRLQTRRRFNRYQMIELCNCLCALTLIGQPKNIQRCRTPIDTLIHTHFDKASLADKITLVWSALVLTIFSPEEPKIKKLLTMAANPPEQLPISVWSKINAISQYCNTPTIPPKITPNTRGTAKLSPLETALVTTLTQRLTPYGVSLLVKPTIADQFGCNILVYDSTNKKKPAVVLSLSKAEHQRHSRLNLKETFRKNQLKRYNIPVIEYQNQPISQNYLDFMWGILSGSLAGLGILQIPDHASPAA